MNITDQDGYELVKRHREWGQYTAEIFAAETEGSGDSVPKELLTKRFCEEGCSKELCNRWGCKEQARSCAGVVSKCKEIGSVEIAIKKGTKRNQ